MGGWPVGVMSDARLKPKVRLLGCNLVGKDAKDISSNAPALSVIVIIITTNNIAISRSSSSIIISPHPSVPLKTLLVQYIWGQRIKCVIWGHRIKCGLTFGHHRTLNGVSAPKAFGWLSSFAFPFIYWPCWKCNHGLFYALEMLSTSLWAIPNKSNKHQRAMFWIQKQNTNLTCEQLKKYFYTLLVNSK